MRTIGALRRSALLAFVLCASCHAAPGADRVLRTYFRYLRAGKLAQAYALTTPAHRARRDLQTFALAVARQPILESGELTLAQRSVEIELVSDDGSIVRVASDAAHVRAYLVDDPLELYPTATPEATLRAFARAVAIGGRERVLPLVAPMLRERVGASTAPLPEAIVELGKRIEQQLRTKPAPIVTDGTSARWLLGDGAGITLEHTSSGWRLIALE